MVVLPSLFDSLNTASLLILESRSFELKVIENTDFIPKNKFFDLPELFQILIEKNFIVKSFCVSDYWNDIGNPVVYKDLSDKFLL